MAYYRSMKKKIKGNAAATLPKVTPITYFGHSHHYQRVDLDTTSQTSSFTLMTPTILTPIIEDELESCSDPSSDSQSFRNIRSYRYGKALQKEGNMSSSQVFFSEGIRRKSTPNSKEEDKDQSSQGFAIHEVSDLPQKYLLKTHGSSEGRGLGIDSYEMESSHSTFRNIPSSFSERSSKSLCKINQDKYKPSENSGLLQVSQLSKDEGEDNTMLRTLSKADLLKRVERLEIHNAILKSKNQSLKLENQTLKLQFAASCNRLTEQGITTEGLEASESSISDHYNERA